ncbi:membrane-bound PQQ-dependent dehydrogenase, glucose/quinate/shikimate family [Serratia rubidaea]|uniref:membrane-bound PQQ-dependent dehydrogenase, glucose/quinate/shikimate family n=1 Tax=Serratia rubidaea TaxID=61652 RepID=UPI003FA34781
MSAPQQSAGKRWFFTAYRLLFVILSFCIGLFFVIWGGKLVSLGGSAYYLLGGLAYLIIAVCFLVRSKHTFWLSLITFFLTLCWALYEVQFNYWGLVPRLVVPALLLMLSLWLIPTLPQTGSGRRRLANWGGLGIFVVLLATLAAAFYPHNVIRNEVALKSPDAKAAPAAGEDNWEFFGRSASGTRFAPYTQITPENVKNLDVAWVYHTGRRTTGSAIGVDENTPLQVGNVLYSCTPENLITALDADSGKALWKFDPQAKTAEHVTCRGVGYYDVNKDDSLSADEKSAPALQQCPQRILVSTVDARFMALNARTGELCPGFGDNGSVDLKQGMGDTENSKRYHPTAAPVVMGHIAIIGGWVRDIVHGEPSGVVRAFDVRTGDVAWAWDVGQPENVTDPVKGRAYTLETPNVWTIPSFDKALNLVYLPTGNGPPDYWGGDRNEAKEKYGSAIVAVDAGTGQTKWVYQTVHHDVWDYDLPSQPVLFDVKNAQGETIPALIQTTKTGQIFVLDRRTGKPVTQVEERAVAQEGVAEGERLSATQPFSVGMPQIGVEPLTEKSMWGVSSFDQLLCRVSFKESAYHGMYTPPSEKPYIEWPSLLGGMNWGGISVDERSGLMFVNDMRMPLRMSLVRKEDVAKYKISTDEVPGFMGTVRPQIAGPYGGVRIDILQSALGVPCNTPPFGTMTAIDLHSKKLVWQVPMGSVQDTGPLGMKTHMPIPLGMPTLGGPTSTASGLVFFAGTQDYYLRALDSATGKELWKARLPVGAVAAPLIYQSPKTGKQYVVISAGGSSHSPDVGDYIIAYALPQR